MNKSDEKRRRQFNWWLGISVILVVFYFVAHHLHPTDEVGRVLWTGPGGTALEWVWWTEIGVAVRELGMAARFFYRASTETSRSWSSGLPSIVPIALTTLLVLILFARQRVVRVIDAPVMPLTFSFGESPGEILVLVGFGMGFFHRLAARCLWATRNPRRAVEWLGRLLRKARVLCGTMWTILQDSIRSIVSK